jgi:hypothetical protein
MYMVALLGQRDLGFIPSLTRIAAVPNVARIRRFPVDSTAIRSS